MRIKINRLFGSGADEAVGSSGYIVKSVRAACTVRETGKFIHISARLKAEVFKK